MICAICGEPAHWDHAFGFVHPNGRRWGDDGHRIVVIHSRE
jgi:hypothetical protein